MLENDPSKREESPNLQAMAGLGEAMWHDNIFTDVKFYIGYLLHLWRTRNLDAKLDKMVADLDKNNS